MVIMWFISFSPVSANAIANNLQIRNYPMGFNGKECPATYFFVPSHDHKNLPKCWRERGGVGYLGMYYFQMERRLGGKEEGLDKVAEDRLARFLFILCSATIGGENWVPPEKLKKLEKIVKA